MIFHSYVKLPEGTLSNWWFSRGFPMKIFQRPGSTGHQVVPTLCAAASTKTTSQEIIPGQDNRWGIVGSLVDVKHPDVLLIIYVICMYIYIYYIHIYIYLLRIYIYMYIPTECWDWPEVWMIECCCLGIYVLLLEYITITDYKMTISPFT